MKDPKKTQQNSRGAAPGGQNEAGQPVSAVSPEMRVRAIVLAVLFAVGGFGLLIYNLAVLQIRDTEKYSTAAAAQQLSDEVITPSRGTIYDTNMKVLAQSATVWTVTASPRDMANSGTDISMAASKLAELLDLDAASLQSKFTADPDSNYVLVKRKIEKPAADAVTQWIKDYNAASANKAHPIAGIQLVTDSKRYYPYGSFASTVLGFTNVDGDGLTGLELYYNDTLKGTPGRIVAMKNAWGYELPGDNYESKYDAENGDSLVLTIDETIQHSLEKYLLNAVNEHKVANRGVGIVMNVKTGAIYAMATMPDYDLNDPYTLYDTALAAQINAVADEAQRTAQRQAAQRAQWRNKAISDIYYPGSVFKVVTASAALDSGKANLNTTFSCTGSFEVAKGVTMNCAEHAGHGTQTFYQGLDNSCNPYFIQLGLRMGADTFCDYLQAFGFTERTGIDMYDEAKSQTVSRANMSNVSLASSSFGQTSSVTPIAMITAVATAVNGGHLVQPHVVRQILDANGNIVQNVAPDAKRQVISETTSATIRSMLADSVESGHGKNARVLGYRIGGKSGTSQKKQSISGEDTQQQYIASFVGFAPADDPEIAVLVFLDEPHSYTTYGGRLAAPVVASVISEAMPYLGFEPQYTAEELASVQVSVPNMVGDLTTDAQIKLNAAGLNAVIRGSGTKVTYQHPAAFTMLPRQSTIVLYTDEGAQGEMTTVPNVVGQSGKTALNLLKNAGLNVSTSGALASSTSVQAVSQNIAQGTQVEEGTLVEVVLHDTAMTD